MKSNSDVINKKKPSSAPSEKLHINKPKWLKTKIPTGKKFFDIKKTLSERKLVTVCEEAKCPNIGECWNTGTATFMVLGDVCTRACRFCHIKTGNPNQAVNAEEPLDVAESCQKMKLKYVVLTMVDRDDMPDGGAAHVAKVISKIKELNPKIIVEVLMGDFQNKQSSLETILSSKPEVVSHNIETVARLTPRVRDARAKYQQSLDVLKKMKQWADYPIKTKSAVMVGLGESHEELKKSFDDLVLHDVDFLTIGQYMRPTKKHLSIKKWYTPQEFDQLKQVALNSGLKAVASAPLVRSSYKAAEFYFANNDLA